MTAPEELTALLARVEGKIPKLTPEQMAEEAEAERARGEAALQRWLTEAGVPKRFLSASLEGGRPTPALRRVTEALGGELQAGRCLVLTGPTSVGKTYAAVAAMRALNRGHFWPWAAAAGALLDPIRRGEALMQLKTNPLIVLDDLGAEYQKEGGLVQAFLDEIVYARHGNELATIVTSNLTVDDLRAHLSVRITDRLVEWGNVYECVGENLRARPEKSAAPVSRSAGLGPSDEYAHRQ